MKGRFVSMGVALLCFAALSGVSVVIFRGLADKATLESRNAAEQTLSALFAGLRDHDDFGLAIENTESLRRAVIGISAIAGDGSLIYSWGDAPGTPPMPDAARQYTENSKNRSVILALRPLRDVPRPPPPDSEDRSAAPRPASSFMGDTLRRADVISLEIRQPAFWQAKRTRQVLFPAVEVLLAGLVFFVRSLVLRNAEYRRRIDEQKNLVVLGTAASTLAHEIKNPLLAIRLQTSILERILPHDGRRELEIINAEVARLSALSHRVNDMLRDPAGNPAATKAAGIAGEVASRLCGRDLVRSAPGAAALARVDPERLRSILENLLRNALESGGSDDGISIEVAEANGRVRIDVLDRGRGISAADRERVFDPFFTTKSRGSGIGLTICRRFVAAAGGTIEIESRPGGGTRVMVLLPGASADGSRRGSP